VIAYDYPLLGLFWTMLVFFLWVSWFMLLFRVVGDIFSSHDLGGGAKALWTIFVIFLPFLGILVYLIARGGSMVHRDVERANQRDEAFQAYVRQAAGSNGTGTADELRKLAALKDEGVLTEAEFAER
jgi:hypothetical protein